jgi:hypothetical protein
VGKYGICLIFVFYAFRFHVDLLLEISNEKYVLLDMPKNKWKMVMPNAASLYSIPFVVIASHDLTPPTPSEIIKAVLSSNVVIPYYYPRLLFHVITPL